MSKVSKYSKLENVFIFPSIDIRLSQMTKFKNASVLTLQHGGSTDIRTNLNMSLAPVDKPRFIQDAMLWRNAIREAERAILPQRYLMQLQYMDTILDTHIKSTINRREGLQFERISKAVVCDENGDVNQEWTEFFQKPWFRTFIKYVLEAKWYGYSLISMGDIVDGQFKNGEGGIVMIPRAHISPDRLCVQTVPLATTGPQFLEEPWLSSHIWISTPDQHGLAACGYGLLYEITLLAIALRNNLEYNQQFLEIFGMPFRWISTDRTDNANLNRLEAGMEMMGSLGYMIVGKDEEIHFEDTSKGAGFKGYGDLEMRLEKKISKAVLGHSDAIDSAGKTPQNASGQSSTGMGSSPQAQALNDIQAEDGDFLTEIINTKLFDFCRRNGINIPKNLSYKFTNDNEEKELAKWQNEQNVEISLMVQQLANGNIQVDPSTLEKIMGGNIKLGLMPQPVQPAAQPNINDKKKALTENALKTNSKEYKAYKQKMDDKTKPIGVTHQQWQDYKTEMEYKRLTKGFDKDDKRIGLDKDAYEAYAEEIQEHLDNGTAPDFEAGESCDIHINCGCYIDTDGYWQTTGDDPCEDCLDLQETYNSEKDKG